MVDEHNYMFKVTNSCVSNNSTDIQCFTHNYGVDELVPYNKYSVKIAAMNSNGMGPFSNVITVMSGENGKI